jgi:CheY-like chemotaxis protein
MKTPLGRRPRVVLVDDDPGLLRLLTIRLRSEGFEVAACESASQALMAAGSDAPPPSDAPAGTLYLDEIGDLPVDLQIALNGLMDEEQTRIISGTARNLSEQVTRGHFREDLFYRLSVSRSDLPPLSQRRDDVPILAAHFLDELARQTGNRQVLPPEAVELLMVSEWPGNMRQLAPLLQHAASLATGPVISAELVQRARGSGTTPQVSTFDEAREEFMRNYLVQLLQITRGNVTQAATGCSPRSSRPDSRRGPRPCRMDARFVSRWPAGLRCADHSSCGRKGYAAVRDDPRCCAGRCGEHSGKCMTPAHTCAVAAPAPQPPGIAGPPVRGPPCNISARAQC